MTDTPDENCQSPAGDEAPYEVDYKDSWAHRSAVMRCSACMWFVWKKPSLTVGRCRRHSPTMEGYPVVSATDWCGDHKPDENTR